MSTVLSIANFNMHCGMDGWGRPYDYVAAIASLDADVIVLEEAWTPSGDGGDGANFLRVKDTARRFHIFDGPVGDGRGGDGVHLEFRTRIELEVRKAWRKRRLLDVGKNMSDNVGLHAFRRRAQHASSTSS